MTTTRPVPDVLWGQDDAETLSALTPDEAIEEHLDDHQTPLPVTVSVVEYKRIPFKPLEPGDIIEWISERLYDEYQHPDCNDGEFATSTRLDAAEDVLVELVNAEYLPTICEVTGEEVTVNTADWVREHAPEWLDKDPALLDGLDSEGTT